MISDIEKIEIGITLEQVEQILGLPYEMNSLPGLHKGNCPNPRPRLIKEVNNDTDIRQIVNAEFCDTNYCCDGNKEDIKHKRVT